MSNEGLMNNSRQFDEENYFDITHSFQVGSATYHVLGLRKDRPTYGSQYYIFHSPSVKRAFLPAIRPAQKTTKTHEEIIRRTIKEETEIFTKALSTSMVDERKEFERFQTSLEQLKSMMKDLSSRLNEQLTTSQLNIKREFDEHFQVFLVRLEEMKKSLTLIEQRPIPRPDEELLNQLKEIKNNQTEMNNRLTQISINREERPSLPASSSSFDQRDTLLALLVQQHEEIRQELITTQKSQLTLIEMMKNESHSSSLSIEQIEQIFSEQTESLTQFIQMEQKNLLVQLNSSNISINSEEHSHIFIQQMTRLFKEQRDFLVLQLNSSNISIKRGEHSHSLIQQMVELFKEQREYLLLQWNESRGRENPISTTSMLNSSSTTLIEEYFVHVRESFTALLIQLQGNDLTGISPPDQGSFKVSIQTGEYADVYAQLFVNDVQCPQGQHTLCQRDRLKKDFLHCFVSPPLSSGRLALKIFAQTKDEDQYRAAITVEMPVINLHRGSMFPQIYPAFHKHQCILIEPFRRFVQFNEELTIHLVLPKVLSVNIGNGDQTIQFDRDEIPQGILKTNIQVRGPVTVRGQWNGQAETDICLFALLK